MSYFHTVSGMPTFPAKGWGLIRFSRGKSLHSSGGGGVGVPRKLAVLR